MLGLMPLKSTGVELFRALHPTYDGRGVLIAILDSGIDPSVPGLIATSTGAPKIVDLRDFSGEGRVALTAFAAPTDQQMKGAARIGRLTRDHLVSRRVPRAAPRPPARGGPERQRPQYRRIPRRGRQSLRRLGGISRHEPRRLVRRRNAAPRLPPGP
ncbi:MAG: hypothetical protein DMD64_13825 [Gemmatimonadetes bacterium]|nr:MAG: hypothetical protein DMD64_13825 [Gemmatimonadota bacterium]